MTHWIHMVGKEYSRASFAKEAKAEGITRRVARGVAERMEYGDTVWLASHDGKSVVVFGKFAISSLSGLSPEEAALMAQLFDLEQVSAGGQMVRRKCGSYIRGATFAITSKDGQPVSIQQLLEQIAGAAVKGKLMIGGDLIEVENVRLKNVKFSRGFRPFDANAFQAEAAKLNGGQKAVKGYFYDTADNEDNVVYLDQRKAQVVGDYRGKDE